MGAMMLKTLGAMLLNNSSIRTEPKSAFEPQDCYPDAESRK